MRCIYCDKDIPTKEKTYEHVVPKCRGGRNHHDNLLPCCAKCNAIRGHLMSREEFKHMQEYHDFATGKGARAIRINARREMILEKVEWILPEILEKLPMKISPLCKHYS